jgi:hypothetical protein
MPKRGLERQAGEIWLAGKPAAERCQRLHAGAGRPPFSRSVKAASRSHPATRQLVKSARNR